MGLVPEQTRTQDSIFIIKGVEVPFVLRKVESGKEEYGLVGDAYVQGVMEGEIVGSIEAGVKDWKRITLV
jgi:hypothetical protein